MPSSVDGTQNLRVAFINRRPIEGNYSLEGYFQRIGASLQSLGVELQSYTSPFVSQGFLSRLKIVRFANQHQADINHITGDIHFAALGTNPTRTVVTVADCGRLHQLSGVKREVLRQIWFQIPLTRVAAITVISEAVKEDLLSWVPDLDPARRPSAGPCGSCFHLTTVHLFPQAISSCQSSHPSGWHHTKQKHSPPHRGNAGP